MLFVLVRLKFLSMISGQEGIERCHCGSDSLRLQKILQSYWCVQRTSKPTDIRSQESPLFCFFYFGLKYWTALYYFSALLNGCFFDTYYALCSCCSTFWYISPNPLPKSFLHILSWGGGSTKSEFVCT